MAALLLSGPALHAQMSAFERPVPPETDAWSFAKYGKVEPTLYTGTVNVSIPFYTYKDSDFEIPVSFIYRSNGCLPNDRAGIMGPGWQLDAGGLITREVRGVPDDMWFAIDAAGGRLRIKGYWETATSDKGFTDSQLYSGRVNDFNTVDCFYLDSSVPPSEREGYDALPDEFHFNFMGYAGSFQIVPDGASASTGPTSIRRR